MTPIDFSRHNFVLRELLFVSILGEEISHYHGEEIDVMVEDYEMAGVGDNIDDELHNRQMLDKTRPSGG